MGVPVAWYEQVRPRTQGEYGVATVLQLRTSERTAFKACRWKWAKAYIEHLRGKEARPALAFGDLVHQALAAWYKPGIKRGRHPANTFENLMAKGLHSGELAHLETMKVGQDTVGTVELGLAMLRGYVEKYGKDEDWEVIASEQTFSVDVDHPVTGKRLFTYVGTFDGLWRNRSTQRLVIPEHKTGAGLDPFGAPETLDEQIGAYWTFSPIWLQQQGLLKPGQTIDHVLMNRLRKAFPDDRPTNAQGQALNKNGSISKQQPAARYKRTIVMRQAEERRNILERLMFEAREMRLCRDGKMAIYKNPDRHCGYCEFRDLCELHEIDSDWEAYQKEMFVTWDPYEDHESNVEELMP